MKHLYSYLALFLALILLLFPLMGQKGAAAAVSGTDISLPKDAVSFRLKRTATGQIEEISAREYVFSVVVGEMPASYNEEALKAQAVAAYTYALYSKENSKDKDYDITDDSSIDQAFIERKDAGKRFGDKVEEYTKKVESCVDSVLGQAVLYNGKPALTLYCSMSAGKTESAENVWGTPFDYLVPVESVGDMLADDYLSTASFTKEEIATALSLQSDIPLKQYFKDIKYSDSGTVLKVSFGDKTFTGKQVRKALSLKSANFSVEYSDEKFTLTVKGHGHLCGMSQNGANYMAMQGSSYKDILLWYYKGCTVG